VKKKAKQSRPRSRRLQPAREVRNRGRKRRSLKTVIASGFNVLRRLKPAALVAGVVAGLLAGAAALAGLNNHVDRMILQRYAGPKPVFLDLPEAIETVAGPQLQARLSDLLTWDWTDRRLCKEMAQRLAESGWVARVDSVRRGSDGTFRIRCRYRMPYAMVQQDRTFLLIDRDGVRLPGTYRYDEKFKLIQGVAMPAAEPGARWPGEDLQAGLAIIEALGKEPFGDQVTAVLVDNFGGRENARRCHIELATDRAGGRVRWGSAPGYEIDENNVVEKLAILRENYRRTGRMDAEHPVIDIVTFPDRFTIPG